jgi:hypothetical protein
MSDQHNPYFEKATQAHKAAKAAEKVFNLNPTAENAFRDYRLSLATLKTGGCPDTEESSTYEVGNMTMEIRKNFLKETPKGYAGPDVVTIEIAGPYLLKLCTALERYCEGDHPNSPYMSLNREQIYDFVQLLRDLRAESLREKPIKD